MPVAGESTEAETADGTIGEAEDKQAHPARRSQLEVQMDILRVVDEGAFLPTQIMYRANLAWAVLRNRLDSLVDSGLLERTKAGEKRLYNLTSKGSFILASFNQIVEAVHKRSLLELPAE